MPPSRRVVLCFPPRYGDCHAHPSSRRGTGVIASGANWSSRSPAPPVSSTQSPPTSTLILLGDRLGSKEEKPRILLECRTRQDTRGQKPRILLECRTRQDTRGQMPTVTQPLFVKRL